MWPASSRPGVFDENALGVLAESVRQLVLLNEGHLGVHLFRCIREDAAEEHGAPGAEHHSFTGVRMGAPLPFRNITTNLAGSVLLALRPTT